MPPVHIMIKPVSGLCNMRCSYCFYADEMEHRSDNMCKKMSETTLENVIRKSLEFADGSCTFAFQGGEPTLAGLDFYQKLLEIEEKYNTKKVKIEHALQTNGYALDDKWCHFFAENNFLVGLSVDGIKATHDAFRKDASGNDTYYHVLEKAECLKKAGVQFNVLTVVNSKTAPKIRRIYEQYRKLGFCWQQYIACLDPIGKLQGEKEFSLTPELYGNFLIELFELWEIDLKQGKQPYIRQFENYISILLGYMPEACEQRGICSFQNVVEADGSVYPCDFYVLDEYNLGNLNENSFEEIQKKRNAIQFVENSCNHLLECKECEYFFICRGGCRKHRDNMGVMDGKNRFCQSYRMFFDACLSRMVEISKRCR